MKRLATLLTCVLAANAISQRSDVDDRMSEIDHGAQMSLTDIAPALKALSTGGEDPKLAALRFWGTHASEADQLFFQNESTASDAEAASKAESVFLNDLFGSLVSLSGSPLHSVSHEALRTICALSHFPGRCATGWPESLGGRAVAALDKIGPAHQGDLLALLDDPEPNVVDFAIYGLGEQERATQQPRIRAMLNSREVKWELVGLHWFKPSTDAELLNTLSPLAETRDDAMRESISRELYEAKIDPVRALTSGVSYSPGMRAELALMLSCGDHPEDLRIAKELLHDPSPRVQCAALRRLEELENAKLPEDQVRVFLTSPEPDARSSALTILWKLKVKDIDSLMAAACEDPDPDVRGQALWIADKLDKRTLIPAMIKAVGLGTDVDWELCGHLLKPGNEGYLEECVGSSNANLRRLAALALIEPEDAQKHVAPLKRLAADSDSDVIGMALTGILATKDPGLYALIPGMLERADPKVRAAMIGELAGRQDAGFLDAVTRYLNDPDAEVRAAAARAVAGLKPNNVPPEP